MGRGVSKSFFGDIVAVNFLLSRTSRLDDCFFGMKVFLGDRCRVGGCGLWRVG